MGDMGKEAITQLLVELREAPQDLMERLFPLLYDELRQLAHLHLRKQRANPTLNTTALIHEAYLRLIEPDRVDIKDRGHFFGVAARAMRFVVIDHARRRGAQKRGGGVRHQPLDKVEITVDAQAADLIALDEALTRLAALNERLSQVVEYRFFGGLSIEETAAVLGVSERTVKRDWKKARLWLYRDMQTEP